MIIAKNGDVQLGGSAVEILADSVEIVMTVQDRFPEHWGTLAEVLGSRMQQKRGDDGRTD